MDDKTRRAEQRNAQKALKERIERLKAANEVPRRSSRGQGETKEGCEQRRPEEGAAASTWGAFEEQNEATGRLFNASPELCRLGAEAGSATSTEALPRSRQRSHSWLRARAYGGTAPTALEEAARISVEARHLSPERLSKMQKLFVRALIHASGPEGSVDHSHLLCFGHDTEHTSTCWDLTATKPTGERLICFIDGDEGTGAPTPAMICHESSAPTALRT